MSSSSTSHQASDFGPNEWLVEEMYQRFQEDPSAVDPAWHEFFADYGKDGEKASSSSVGTEEPADTSSGNGSAPAASSGGVTRGAATEDDQGSGSGTETGAAGSGDAPAQKAVTNGGKAGGKGTATSRDVPPPVTPKAEPPPAEERLRTASAPAPASSSNGTPAKPAAGSGSKAAKPTQDGGGATTTPLRGAANAIAKNMTASLELPTATSVRAVPAKLLADNRIVINNHLKRTRGGKLSFTHLIGYALVRALTDFPNMNRHFAETDGKPSVATPEHVNLGLAMDMPGKDGSRSLIVVSIKGCENMSFAQFWQAYEGMVRKARDGKLTADDFAGTTISLTNPGTLGTNHSVPRLSVGQGAIVGVGAMEYPAAFQGASEERLVELGISKIITLTSTYDHRIIQGAESGDFLRRIHQLLLGEDGFYDDIFASLRVPYEPVRWVQDFPEGEVDKTARVLELIESYRTRGHLMADTDPLNYRQRRHPDLDVLSHGLTLWDLDRDFAVGGFGGQSHMKLRDVLGLLRNSYCRTIGTEYMHIADPEQRKWLEERIEVAHVKPDPSEQKYILSRLNAAEAFETFLQTKYVGQKRFSLEGGETVIPLLDAVLDKAAERELDEVVIGMPHRGRLNVLANIVGKPISQIFREFEGNLDPGQAHGSGDVKYHLGAEGKYFRMFGDGETAVSLTANPSHLEAVDPVLEGIVRAKQDILDKGDGGFTVLPVLMHGDAAFAGQGVVAETLNLALLRGYRTGGTVHVVVNNQVGFTTAPEHSRSSQYCTDVAKMIGAPVFHVNGDDPEACVWVAKLAVEYRQRWNNDVVIDMICYRRRGHNEGDDPSMTQPSMYDIIDAKRSVRKIYTESLIGRGDITMEEAEQALKDFSNQLEHVFNEVRELEKTPPVISPSIESEQLVPSDLDTSVPLEVVHRIGDVHANLPEGFAVHKRVEPVLRKREKMSREGDVDWAFAELLAIGSLAMDGRLVRLSGQDSRRGTFVQRHSVLIDRHTGAEYFPLRNLAEGQGRFLPYDSALSEFAAVGFEYGYSVANSDALVMWEGQFGDFVNGAQSIIDEFISSGEAKWGQLSDVALLLPHGLEGQGPDHSSGRIERFLQLCAEGSMTVALPSDPANYFHLLRQHTLDGVRRPLVVFTPKWMLRAKQVVSPLSDFTEGRFRPVIDDPEHAGKGDTVSGVKRVLFCSGKIYWELAAARDKRRKNGDTTVDEAALVRVERLYPMPAEEIAAVLERYPEAAGDVRWVQEEPANQGSWPYYGLELPQKLPQLQGSFTRVSRRRMAAPAAGSSKVHEVEQAELIDKAFAG
ncbi:multifunctional oxoglutarate decarboxylase/oxoglutarate dehydrogenase thiamine pyrophosphate-binding subunit/dihydrolipoyllysine-residue succinyltransferase subunit [Pseudonocardia sp. McavD-2-B]|uniref:multifunctional oxoglutarate decarboxylase/oxoglutarate dehydrogenase thiamine pyrophosphate-binding subunit/dihydrolipoyllysine-residue succinyltransferase subunit n=1 Tax=Pseudonocardia sp. McavD-2-B TaxID=2954499 RepID=UPI0020969B52|nr:multifunctional oxoglutarate decarboxylase/oxoglutarate dehydrogenase thiamine pyrophosphate-binding subunit/dihydrolipoyllysine-residue succinyltransferase subunit [Pseudonocardia sp. McavD-2-B]MCO7196131.1 multifunctional oxoglutarate decarboxylase/oxoglutarate dehydrogenase thiamine pyrophosphate-binding subunit/dihydrolipoyllysine-residue succinyltransferase subunit [Pseudonocardia sp. McavD-2-B]